MEEKMKPTNIRKLVILAMLSAVALAVTYLSKLIPIHVAGFLNPDFKDIVVVIGGFIFGPLAAAVIAVVSSFIEMLTISHTGLYGLLMNVVSTCAFTCIAAVFYYRKRTSKSAVIGLISGVLFVTAIMLLWNYIITPIYLGIPRAGVVKMLVPTFLPFNLLKYGMNATFAILLYKPVVVGLRKAGLLPARADGKKGKVKWGLIAAAAFIFLTLALLFLVLAGVI